MENDDKAIIQQLKTTMEKYKIMTIRILNEQKKLLNLFMWISLASSITMSIAYILIRWNIIRYDVIIHGLTLFLNVFLMSLIFRKCVTGISIIKTKLIKLFR